MRARAPDAIIQDVRRAPGKPADRAWWLYTRRGGGVVFETFDLVRVSRAGPRDHLDVEPGFPDDHPAARIPEASEFLLVRHFLARKATVCCLQAIVVRVRVARHGLCQSTRKVGGYCLLFQGLWGLSVLRPLCFHRSLSRRPGASESRVALSDRRSCGPRTGSGRHARSAHRFRPPRSLSTKSPPHFL